MDVYLNEVVRYLVAQSWQIATLTLAVALAAWALRHRTAHIRYLLWLLVLAKCLVPPFYAVPLKILPQATVPASAPAPSLVAPVKIQPVANGAKFASDSMMLSLAAAMGMTDVVELAISQNADLNAKNEYGETPLLTVVSAGRKAMVEQLIAKGANVNVKDAKGQTPLHRAAVEGHGAIAELLIAKDADVNARDNQGRTPLWYAKDRGHTEIVELLQKHGAKE